MSLYKDTNGKITLIKEKRFKIEKDIQSLVEKNLAELFGIEFIASERTIQNLRIDTLAYDSDAKTFVIIEYKRDSSFSIVDQGFSYLSLLLNNKADFILEYNEQNNENLRRDDIDWSQARIIFISPSYTTHQINAVNFKNIPFELWEIKQYENGTISLTDIKFDDSSEVIPNLNEKPEITKARKELVEYSETTFFNQRKKMRDPYFSFKEKILGLYPELVFEPKKNSINVKHKDNWRVITYINILTDKIRFTFTRSKPSDFQDSKNRLIHDQNGIENKGQDLSHIDAGDDDIDYAIILFQQAYQRYKKEFIER